MDGQNANPYLITLRYYPTDSDIINAMQKAKREVPTKVDQKNMAMLVSLWKEDKRDYFEYRPLKPGTV